MINNLRKIISVILNKIDARLEIDAGANPKKKLDKKHKAPKIPNKKVGYQKKLENVEIKRFSMKNKIKSFVQIDFDVSDIGLRQYRLDLVQYKNDSWDKLTVFRVNHNPKRLFHFEMPFPILLITSFQEEDSSSSFRDKVLYSQGKVVILSEKKVVDGMAKKGALYRCKLPKALQEGEEKYGLIQKVGKDYRLYNVEERRELKDILKRVKLQASIGEKSRYVHGISFVALRVKDEGRIEVYLGFEQMEMSLNEFFVDVLVKNKGCTKSQIVEIKSFARQMFNAVKHLEKRQVAHLGLNFHSILVSKKEEPFKSGGKYLFKLSRFDFTEKVGDLNESEEKFFIPKKFQSPEMYRKGFLLAGNEVKQSEIYSEKLGCLNDVWALGMISWEMILGCFFGTGINRVLKNTFAKQRNAPSSLIMEYINNPKGISNLIERRIKELDTGGWDDMENDHYNRLNRYKNDFDDFYYLLQKIFIRRKAASGFSKKPWEKRDKKGFK